MPDKWLWPIIDSKPQPRSAGAEDPAIPAPNDVDRNAAAKTLKAADDLAQVRALVIASSGSSIIMPLRVLLVFRFAVIVAALNLFAAGNAFDILAAASVGVAIFLMLEMDRRRRRAEPDLEGPAAACGAHGARARALFAYAA